MNFEGITDSDESVCTNLRLLLEPTIHQIAITIQSYATGCSFHTISETFGVDKSTVSLVVKKVTDVIKAKLSDHLNLPKTHEQHSCRHVPLRSYSVTKAVSNAYQRATYQSATERHF